MKCLDYMWKLHTKSELSDHEILALSNRQFCIHIAPYQAQLATERHDIIQKNVLRNCQESLEESLLTFVIKK